MNKSSLYTFLTYAGALPFIACAIMPMLGMQQINPLGSVENIISSYGLVILAFMAGVHWGTYLFYDTKCPINLFIASNIVVIIAWLSYFNSSIKITLPIYATAFAFLLYVDYRLRQNNIITAHYFKTRMIVSLVVLTSLIGFTLIAA